ncbi:MAG: LutB/LldF family L-lactate oxidation iron-sulfur protein [Bacteroidales bacterium]|jgi:L-lactate dehydrogenase complex protein LldF|nr:LutB/LldF family L-lactate oxidation iron-sulfur protein [Bacteroidales bacterium]
MSEIAAKFLKESKLKAFDLDHRKKINFNIGKYNNAFKKGLLQYQNLDLAKSRAANIKSKTVNDLDKYLVDFELNFTNNGGKVIWAVDAEEARNEVLKILKKHGAKQLVKMKSMTTEEIELNPFLEKQGIESLETDLGEYIVQLAGEKPYHIVTPAMHKSKEDIALLFNEKMGWDEGLSPEQITSKVRVKLRDKFYHADVGITGANFLIADTGSFALTENEGNGVLCMSMPKVHIAIAGIEKIIPSINDLDIFWPLLSSHGTGQHMSVYNSIINGPKKPNEKDGPEECYVIILNNKRTQLLEQEEQRVALSCIRCGACLNACPVYKNIGGHTYEATYSGPIGSVISPWMLGMKDYKHLSFASTLCGACTEVCPVKIPLHDLLLLNRRDAVSQKYTTSMERISVKGSSKFLMNRKWVDFFSGKTKQFFISLFIKKLWGNNRTFPPIADKSFHDEWVKK